MNTGAFPSDQVAVIMLRINQYGQIEGVLSQPPLPGKLFEGRLGLVSAVEAWQAEQLEGTERRPGT